MLRATKNIFLITPLATFSCYWLYDARERNETSLLEVCASENKFQLEQVQVFFRHGARTPIKSQKRLEQFSNIGNVSWDVDIFMRRLPCTEIEFAIDMVDGSQPADLIAKHGPKLLGGCVSGQLTTVGQQQSYDLGKWLANEYIAKHDLISPVYNSSQISIRSTNTSRTLLTSVCLVAGLYGKENVREPVLIQSKGMDKDDLLPNYGGCLKLNQRFKHYWYNHQLPDCKDDLKSMNELMGLQVDGQSFNSIEICDIIKCRESHDLYIPQYLLDGRELMSKHALNLQQAILGFENVEGMRISVGSVLETICCRINEAIAGPCENKMLLYSSHDTLILSLLAALDIFDGEWPPFCANVILELYKGSNDERFIRILYNGNVVVMGANSNEEFIPVDKFMKLVEQYRVLDWDEDCGNTHSHRDIDFKDFRVDSKM